ncbi:MAG: Ig-like domain-containing protein [Lachnospiraceae bacterium]|nr:Ig-like domain-containing protein [Lachnospiraceae bacterium]
MKQTNNLKKAFAFALSLSLAAAINPVSAMAQSVKGVVAPLTVVVNDDGGLMGSSDIQSWNEPGLFSSDFNSYTVSADIYFPCSYFMENDGSVFIDPKVSFWFEDLGVNGYLESDTVVRVGFDYGKNCVFWKGLNIKNDEETDDIPCVKNAKVVGDMVKVEIVDATLNPTFKTQDWDEATGSNRIWTDPIPATGDAVPLFRVSMDRAFEGKIAVANASIKIGDKNYKTDYSKKGAIAGFYGEIEQEFTELNAEIFNTSIVSVGKKSVKIKPSKSATVKVATMFSDDKVNVSSSSAKVAKVTYKNGKLTIKGIKKGKATISVKVNGVTQKIKVTVK